MRRPRGGNELACLRNRKWCVWSMFSEQQCGRIGRQGSVDHAGPCRQYKDLEFARN